MRGKADANGHVANGVFEYQVPADNPGNEFAHSGVGVRVRTASDWDHGGELCVTNRSEATRDCDKDERKGDRGASAGSAKRRGVVNKILEQRRVEDGRSLEFLSGDSCANDGENAGADYSADAERSEAQPAEGLFQPEFGAFTIGNELVNILATEKR